MPETIAIIVATNVRISFTGAIQVHPAAVIDVPAARSAMIDGGGFIFIGIMSPL